MSSTSSDIEDKRSLSSTSVHSSLAAGFRRPPVQNKALNFFLSFSDSDFVRCPGHCDAMVAKIFAPPLHFSYSSTSFLSSSVSDRDDEDDAPIEVDEEVDELREPDDEPEIAEPDDVCTAT